MTFQRHRRHRARATRASCSSPARTAFSATRVMLGARAALIGMGAALPDLQAEPARAPQPSGDWPPFYALSALCDRLAAGHVRARRWRATSAGCSGPRRPTARCPPTRATIRGARRSRPERAGRRRARRCGMRARLARDFERFGRGLPRRLAAHVREAYAHRPRPRATSATPARIRSARARASSRSTPISSRPTARAGLAFVVLKTVIAEDAAGERTMGAWAIHETGCGSSGALGRRAGGLDGHLEGQGMGPLVRRLPGAGPRPARDLDPRRRDARRALGQVPPAAAGRAVPRRPSTAYTTAGLAAAWGDGDRCRSRRISRRRSPGDALRRRARHRSSAGCARCPAQIRAAAGGARSARASS